MIKRIYEKLYYRMGFAKDCSQCTANQYVIRQAIESASAKKAAGL